MYITEAQSISFYTRIGVTKRLTFLKLIFIVSGKIQVEDSLSLNSLLTGNNASKRLKQISNLCEAVHSMRSGE
jgi:hypothetical protein